MNADAIESLRAARARHDAALTAAREVPTWIVALFAAEVALICAVVFATVWGR
jgi:hypothetical protein